MKSSGLYRKLLEVERRLCLTMAQQQEESSIAGDGYVQEGAASSGSNVGVSDSVGSPQVSEQQQQQEQLATAEMLHLAQVGQ